MNLAGFVVSCLVCRGLGEAVQGVCMARSPSDQVVNGGISNTNTLDMA